MNYENRYSPEKVHDVFDDRTEDQFVAEVVHSFAQRNVDGVIPARPKNLIHYCSTTGKPTRSFATERVSLDSV